MAFRLARWGCSCALFGTPGQTKVNGDRQRETTHKICCLAAELHNKGSFNNYVQDKILPAMILGSSSSSFKRAEGDFLLL